MLTALSNACAITGVTLMPLKSSQIEFRFASCHVDSCGVVALTGTSISVGLIYLSSLHECPKNLLNCSRNLSSKLTTALSFRRVLKPLFLPFPPIKALRPLMIQLIIPCFSCGMAYVPTVVQSHSDKHSLAIFYPKGAFQKSKLAGMTMTCWHGNLPIYHPIYFSRFWFIINLS